MLTLGRAQLRSWSRILAVDSKPSMIWIVVSRVRETLRGSKILPACSCPSRRGNSVMERLDIFGGLPGRSRRTLIRGSVCSLEPRGASLVGQHWTMCQESYHRKDSPSCLCHCPQPTTPPVQAVSGRRDGLPTDPDPVSASPSRISPLSPILLVVESS
jgi:hypothetical protein